MEILDYARAKGRILVILVILPLVAGGAAFVLLARQPPRYRSHLEVAIPTPIASGASAVGLYVANFRQAIASRGVVERVAVETGVPIDDLRGGLEVRQVGQANQMEVQFTGRDADAVSDVPRSATSATLESLASGRLDYQRRKLAVAEEQYERARTDVETFSKDTGLIFPEDEYRAADQALRDLEGQLATAQATAAEVSAEVLLLQVDALRAERDALGSQLPAYQRLEETLGNATSARREASGELLNAEAQLALVSSPDILGATSSAPLPRAQTLASGVVLAAGAAFLLALGIVTLPDLLARGESRPAQRGRRPDPEGDSQLGMHVAGGVPADAAARSYERLRHPHHPRRPS